MKATDRPQTRRVLDRLRRFESRNVTAMAADGSWPIVWERARGGHVWDADGRRYLDLTAAFGVAAAGHGNPAVVRAGQRQMARLAHAMGDVHPHPLKGELARELSRLTYGRWQPGGTGKCLFANSGFEAVEAALKTARLATGRPGVIAFAGGYHGLGYGALNVTHRDHFRRDFRNQLREFGHFVPFPTRSGELPPTLNAVRRALRRGDVGAVLIEPIQARGGIRVPANGFLPELQHLCRRHDALLILDEIYTGFGRTGRWFACEHSGVVPDLICLGKALTGGFPLSACVGRADVMDAWPVSTGEAIHTSTFLGHPVGCAMALAQIAEIRRLDLPRCSARLGRRLLSALAEVRAPGLEIEARGVGLMAGLAFMESPPHGGRIRSPRPATETVWGLVTALLDQGFIFLPEGEHGEVLAWTPPLTIAEPQLLASVRAVTALLGRRQ